MSREAKDRLRTILRKIPVLRDTDYIEQIIEQADEAGCLKEETEKAP